MLRKSLMICRQRGEHHPDTATCYTNLALNLNAQGKYTEAEPLIRRAPGDPPPSVRRGQLRYGRDLRSPGLEP